MDFNSHHAKSVIVNEKKDYLNSQFSILRGIDTLDYEPSIRTPSDSTPISMNIAGRV